RVRNPLFWGSYRRPLQSLSQSGPGNQQRIIDRMIGTRTRVSETILSLGQIVKSPCEFCKTAS
ncbi:MAG: hypothetical protein RR068_12530, partial [Hafnia sp.]